MGSWSKILGVSIVNNVIFYGESAFPLERHIWYVQLGHRRNLLKETRKTKCFHLDFSGSQPASHQPGGQLTHSLPTNRQKFRSLLFFQCISFIKCFSSQCVSNHPVINTDSNQSPSCSAMDSNCTWPGMR